MHTQNNRPVASSTNQHKAKQRSGKHVKFTWNGDAIVFCVHISYISTSPLYSFKNKYAMYIGLAPHKRKHNVGRRACLCLWIPYGKPAPINAIYYSLSARPATARLALRYYIVYYIHTKATRTNWNSLCSWITERQIHTHTMRVLGGGCKIYYTLYTHVICVYVWYVCVCRI